MKSMRNKLQPPKIRRQYQRDFKNWLSENRDQFLVKPLNPKATVRYVSLSFQNMSPVLRIKIYETELAVIITWENKFFDMIFDEDMVPIRTGNRYRCRLCEESEETFQDLAAMRRDHLYLPFLKWCNERLFTAKLLRMSWDNGSSGVDLKRETDSLKENEVVTPFLRSKQKNRQRICRRRESIIFYLPVFDIL